MGTKSILLILTTSLLIQFQCKNHDSNAFSSIKEVKINQIDSIALVRLDKPSWIEREEYPEEKISIFIDKERYELSRNGNTVFVGNLQRTELDSLLSLAANLKSTQIDRIYNSNQPWLPDIEVSVYCTPVENSFMIKTFGNFGDIPLNIQRLNSFLLRKMRESFSQL